MSKGSTQRPGDHKAYSDNYDRIFNRDKVECSCCGSGCIVCVNPINLRLSIDADGAIKILKNCGKISQCEQ